MKISELKNHLKNLNEITIIDSQGNKVPPHFHVTEVGMINKKFIDCGGTIREEKVANFQLWSADDVDHRLSAEKLIKIIELSEQQIGLEDLEIEVEYQTDTIGKYGLEFDFNTFMLTSKQTDCLAKDNCGVPVQKKKIKLSELTTQGSCCSPDSGCC